MFTASASDTHTYTCYLEVLCIQPCMGQCEQQLSEIWKVLMAKNQHMKQELVNKFGSRLSSPKYNKLISNVSTRFYRPSSGQYKIQLAKNG